MAESTTISTGTGDRSAHHTPVLRQNGNPGRQRRRATQRSIRLRSRIYQWQLRHEGTMVAVLCIWCLFWMIQPAIYLSPIKDWSLWGFPAHYAFWLLGMVLVIPASCFLFTMLFSIHPRSDGEEENDENVEEVEP